MCPRVDGIRRKLRIVSQYWDSQCHLLNYFGIVICPNEVLEISSIVIGSILSCLALNCIVSSAKLNGILILISFNYHFKTVNFICIEFMITVYQFFRTFFVNTEKPSFTVKKYVPSETELKSTVVMLSFNCIVRINRPLKSRISRLKSL